MVRASGYLQSLDDFRKIPLLTTDAGVPVRLGDVARVQVGPEMRRGIAELNGEGEVAGGIIVMRAPRCRAGGWHHAASLTRVDHWWVFICASLPMDARDWLCAFKANRR